MLSFIKRLWSNPPEAPSAPIVVPVHPPHRGSGLDVFQGGDPGDFAVTRYPPFDKGIPVINTDKILQAQQELIDRIFRTAGVSREDFAKLYIPPITNLARYVHLLPATSTTYFRGTGGLFRMSLEIALNSLQSANAAVFPTGGHVERRFFMQPKWTLGSFLAGLCCQTYRTVNSMAVMTKDNVQWTPLLEHLYDWCVKLDAEVYFVRWMEDAHVHGAQASAAYSISHIVPQDVLQYLAIDNNQVMPAMTASIAGVDMNTSENPIGRLVAPVITRVIEDDLKRSATNYGHLVIGAHLEMHLLDAMRRLVRSGKWIANNETSGGRVWVGQEGVFIDWSVAASDIANLLAKDSFAGVPKDPDTLADLLVSANLLESDKKGGRYWNITLPGTFEAKEGMVKLREGTVIFPQGYDLSAFANVVLILKPNQKKKTPSNAPENEADARAGQLTTSAPAKPREAKQEREDTSALRTDKYPTNTPVCAEQGFASHDPAESFAPPEQDFATHEALPVSEPEQASWPEENVFLPHCGSPVETENQKEHRTENVQTVPVSEKAQSSQDKEQKSSNDSASQEKTTRQTPRRAGSHLTATKLLGSLKDSNAWLLNEVITAYQNKKLIKPDIVALPYGFGISHVYLGSHGIPVMELLEELAQKSWLWQDKTRYSRRIHPIEVEGKTIRLVILKTEIAAGLGFDTSTQEGEHAAS